MNAIEIRNLTKVFGEKTALAGLDMTVPTGAIYGFIGENGSGKSTTEKIISGLIPGSGGEVKLFGHDHTDGAVRESLSVLIEAPGCFPNMTVWGNMVLQARNLGIENATEEIIKVLKLVRMEGAANNKYKSCSLGMKQRIGIAMALLGNPKLLVLDEPLNGLDADGMRIMREVLVDITRGGGVTVVISSHILGELEKVATHYGIIRGGKMIKEMTAAELEADCPTYVGLKARDNERAKANLACRYSRVTEDEDGYIRVYGDEEPSDVVAYLYEKGIAAEELFTAKISLDEYYTNIMKGEK